MGQNGNGLKTDKNGNRTEIKRERNGITRPVVWTVNENFFLMPTVHDGEGKLAFHKINPLCKLEERHAVDLGSGYKNDCIWHA